MTGSILIKPIVTEKSIKEAEKRRFTFQVSVDAGKRIIKKVVEDTFSVNVISITTTIVKGRSIRTGKKRVEVTLSPWKKATVRLKDNQTIALFESGGQS